jgi:hypothetical protein
MSNRERLLKIAEWHQQEASKHLKQSRLLKHRKKACFAALALADQHGEAASVLRRVAEQMPAILSFRELIREDRVLCGHPVVGPYFSLSCNRIRGHAGAHRSATLKSDSVECPHCHWGFAPGVIDQHIREKHT